MNSFKSLTSILVVTLLAMSVSRVRTQPILIPPKITDGSDFHVIQKQMNDHFEQNPGAKGYKQWKRKEWFLEPRLFPTGKMENLTLKTWKAYDRYMQTIYDSRSTHGSWIFLGPTQCAGGLGRLNAIAFHPTDENIMYVGSSNGGVWKTINGGTTWANVSPMIPMLAVADIKLSPANPEIIYLLTGDGDPDPGEDGAHGQTEVSSIGILRSTDGGNSWYPTNFSFDHPSVIVPTKLLIHPTNVNIQFVVGHSGIIRTTNQWSTWTTVQTGTVYDIEYKPDDPNIMYAGTNNDILKSTDGGASWDYVMDSDFIEMSSATRVEIAVAPNNANVVYALGGNWEDLQAFYVSTSEGNDNSWTLQNSTATSMGSYTDYCVALAVDPTDWTDVFAGMQWINKSSNSGVSWASIVDGAVHADIHDVAFANGALWVCCDGGLYKSVNEGVSWTELSTGLAITEIYRISGTPQDVNRYFLGCQDNGTMRRDAVTSNFDEAYGGDGMTCIIDYTDWDIVYASSQHGNFGKSLVAGNQGTFVDLNVPGQGPWISPMIMDPTVHTRLFVGTSEVYRSDNGGNMWTELQTPTSILEVNCLAQGTNVPSRLYASGNNFIYRATNALTSPVWTSIGAGLPDLFITGIAVDPANANRVFVSLSGYVDGDKVFRSVNGGDAWTDISGSLPNVPINCIRFHDNGADNDALYVGTDIGVFYRDNDIGNWVYFSNGMPVVNVSDLYINTANSTITAGTYGRGLWRSSLYTACVTNLVFGASSPNSGIRYYSCTNEITSSTNYRNDIGTEINYKAGNSITLTTDFQAGGYGVFHGKIGPCPGITMEPLMSPFNPSGPLVMNGFKLKASD